MQFCNKCGSFLQLKRNSETGTNVLVCPKCGELSPEEMKQKSVIKKNIRKNNQNTTVVIDKTQIKDDYLPRVKILCPKCHYEEATYFQMQTRSADEPPTSFYTCLKCGHKWREYQ